MTAFNRSRRDFLKTSAVLGSGLIIGCHVPSNARLAQMEKGGVFEPNAWIRIGADDRISIIVAKSEMGQGVHTAMPMLVAEELEVDLGRIALEIAPADPVYKDELLGIQVTGGSTSVRSGWQSLREAGAAARTMLVQAAAQAWGVAPESCRAEDGTVVHGGDGRRLGYGALAEAAAKLPLPQQVALKPKAAFRVLGKPTRRLDTPAKVDGSAVFGIDVKIPGMRYAVLAQCPVFGGKASAYEADRALTVRGVEQVVAIDSGIAVVADSFWNAKKGRDALEITWDEGPRARLSDASIRAQFEEALQRDGAVARRVGDPEALLETGPKTIQALYSVPYLAHATMEPMNCTADVREDGCDLWVGTQAQGLAQQTAARLTGLAPEKIQVHTVFLGGGFGRRFEQDFVHQAVQISMQVKSPVKLIWTREDDTQHDLYRPATLNRLEAVLGQDGSPMVWTHRIAGPSIMSRAMPDQVKNGIDPSSVEGAENLPYAIPNLRVDYVLHDPGVPVGFWRSVGNSQNGFITESFIDELAVAAGEDPVAYRLRLLTRQPRHAGVLKLAAEKARWGEKPRPGIHRGVAVVASFGSFVAQVAEVSVSKRQQVRVHRVVCAVDCGMTVNPDTIVAQMESGIVFGLTAALKGRIGIENGRVAQSNFHDYPLLRMDEMPEVEVHIVPSDEAPGGVGEPGTPPIAPAVANAVYAATGKRIRRLPIDLADA